MRCASPMPPRLRALAETWGGLAGKLLIAAWLGLALLGIASLGVSHTAPMPEPTREERLARALLALREQTGRPFLVHVIYARCSCTQRLFAHLVQRKALPGTEEAILFVGEDPGKRERARAAGFRFLDIAAPDLGKRFGLEVAPVLFAFDAGGRMEYAGGYFDRPAAVTALDERVVADLRRGSEPKALPVYGCAVSAALQKTVDPLGIVYGGG